MMTGRAAYFRALAVLLALSSLPGSRDEPAKQDVAPPAENSGATRNVAILGDATRKDLLTNIATAHGVTVKTNGRWKVADAGSLRFLSSDEESIATQAALAWDADLVLLAVDATQGPLIVHREHILVSRQMAVPTVGIAFTKSRALEDPELLGLEETEMRETLNHYGLPGDTALCIFDHQATKTPAGSKAPKGPIQSVIAMADIAKKRNKSKGGREEKRFKAVVYSLALQEASRDVAPAVKSGPTTALVGGESVAAEVTAPHGIAPGENGEIEIVFERPMQVADTQRFLLLSKQHISAVGSLLANGAGSR